MRLRAYPKTSCALNPADHHRLPSPTVAHPARRDAMGSGLRAGANGGPPKSLSENLRRNVEYRTPNIED